MFIKCYDAMHIFPFKLSEILSQEPPARGPIHLIAVFYAKLYPRNTSWVADVKFIPGLGLERTYLFFKRSLI